MNTKISVSNFLKKKWSSKLSVKIQTKDECILVEKQRLESEL